jgi:hypothetical protein
MEDNNYSVSEVFGAINNLREFIQNDELSSKTESYTFSPIDFYLNNPNNFSPEDKEKINTGLVGIFITELKKRHSLE